MALENKLGIKSSAELAREEERISKKKAVELFENGMLEKLEAGKFQTLCEIHKYLFDDIYDFAGKIRTVRIWLDMMLKKQIGQVVDWSKIEKEDYLMAMERSPIKDIEIKYILNAALTDQINDREIYMKGIDHSYYYEGYVTYKTEEL